MKNLNKCVYCLLLSTLCLSGCKKEEVLDKPVDFGVITDEESTTFDFGVSVDSNDDFYIYDNLNGEFDTFETKSVLSKEEREENIEKEVSDVRESISDYIEEVEKEKSELGINKKENVEFQTNLFNDTSELDDLGDGLVASMKSQIYNGEILQEDIDNVKSFIDENFSSESEEVRDEIYNYIISCWEDYNVLQESLAALPPEETWSSEELQKNPDLINFSRSEYEYIQKKGEESGVITYDNFDWSEN